MLHLKSLSILYAVKITLSCLFHKTVKQLRVFTAVAECQCRRLRWVSDAVAALT